MSPQEVFRQTRILYLALLAGQILFCSVIVFALLDPETRQSGWPAAPFGTLLPILMAGLLPLVLYLNRQQLVKAGEQPDLSSKLAHYRTLVIMRSALIEGMNLFFLVILLLENNTTLLIFFAFGLLLFLYFRPSVNEFLSNYQLSGAEKAEFNDGS